MGSDVSGSYLRGLVIPDSRITSDAYSSTDSSITQAGPKPGDPEPQSETDMVLESSGTQSAGKQLRIKCTKAGNAGDGRFVWKYEADTVWRGWEPPNTISGFEFLDFTTTASKWLYPHAITLTDGTILVVVQESQQYVTCFTRSVTAGTWTETTIYDNSSTYTTGAFPTVVQRPDGRILCFFITEDSTANESQVRMFYSDDGTTWTIGGQDLLSEAIDTSTYTPTRMRVAMLPNGHMTLMVGVSASLTYDSIAFQYASTNSGARFDLIDDTGWTGATDATSLGYFDLCVTDGRIMLAYLREGSSTRYRPYVRFIGSVNQLFSAAAETGAYQSSNTMDWCSKSAGGAYENGDLALAVDDDGTLYMIGRDESAGTPRECYTQRSTDGGATWKMTSYGSANGLGGAWWASKDTAIYPTGMCATVQAGRVVVFSNFASDATTRDPSLCATYLGGYTTVALPFKNNSMFLSEVISWERTWLPFCKPSDLADFTESATGAAVSALDSSGLIFTAANGEDLRYIATPATAIDQGLIVLCQVKVNSGTFVINARVANATPVSYTVRVVITGTSIVLRDVVAGSAITTVSDTVAATGVQILLALGNGNGALGNTGKVYAWYRPATLGTEEDREWTLLGNSSTVQAGSTSGDELYVGALSSIAGGCIANMKLLLHTYDEYTGQQLYSGQTNPRDLPAKQFSSLPTWVNDGVKIRATSGPAYNGDEWNIDTRYEYGIENIFSDVSASPNRPWRSTGETQQDIVIDLHAEETQQLGGYLAVCLFGCNFKTFSIAGMDLGTNTFVDILASGDTSGGQSGLSFSRTGDIVMPSTANTGSASAYWYPYNALTGSHIKLTNGGTTTYHKITHSSEGGWRRDLGTSNQTKLARIRITDADSSDPSGGLLQTADILAKDVICMIPNPGTMSQLRIRIDAQDTNEGYLSIGAICIGHVAVFGRQYSYGRSLAVDPLFDMKEGRSGRRRVTRLGPSRRSAEFAWLEGVDTSGMNGTGPVPDFVTSYTSGDVVGSTADTPLVTLGIIEALGPDHPVVYLPSIPRGATSAAFQIVDRRRFLYGRIVSAGRIENVLGNETESPGEVFTVGAVRIEEEL